MSTEKYFREKIQHDVNGSELEHGIQYYLTDHLDKEFGDFTITKVSSPIVDGKIFPDTAIEATTTSGESALKRKFKDDAESVGESDEFHTLLYFTTEDDAESVLAEEIEEAQSKYDLDVQIIDRTELVNLVTDSYETLSKHTESDEETAREDAFKLVFKHD